MNPESLHSTQKRRYRVIVACVAVIIFLIAAGAALATVPAVRDHLCYEHRMNMFCSVAQIGESDMRVFAWYPKLKPLDREASILRRSVPEIPPDDQRAYDSHFSSGKHQRLYWEARLTSRTAPARPIRFVVHWATVDVGGKSVASGVVEATWGADDPAAFIIGPVDTVPTGTAGQLPPGHYEIVLKVYGNQLAESEVRGGFDIY